MTWAVSSLSADADVDLTDIRRNGIEDPCQAIETSSREYGEELSETLSDEQIRR
jgi:hypothetical protein